MLVGSSKIEKYLLVSKNSLASVGYEEIFSVNNGEFQTVERENLRCTSAEPRSVLILEQRGES
jgi:hypothetical protein